MEQILYHEQKQIHGKLILIIIMILCMTTIFILLFTTSAAADGVATSGAQFLKIGAGARAMSMGGAYVAFADDAYALYWNPAALSHIRRREAIFTYTFYMQDMRFGYIGFITPNRYGCIGSSITYLIHEDIEGFDSEARSTGWFKANEFAWDISYGKNITDRLSIGGNIKLIRQRIADKKGMGMSIDIGSMLLMNKYLTFGAICRNITLKRLQLDIEKEHLPLTFAIGTACRVPDIGLSITCDITLPCDNKPYINIGGEYWYQHTLSARLGYRGGPGTDAGFTAGFGYSFGLFSIDYAMEPFGTLGNSHHVSFQYRF
jgi:hypothetical protein